MADLTNISDQGKGICGFVSIIRFLIDNGAMTQQQFQSQYQGNALNYAMEWVETQIAHDASLKKGAKVATALNQSIKFTNDFVGDYQNYTVENLKDPNKWEGLALTPEAICDYLLRKYNIKTNITILSSVSLSSLWQIGTHSAGAGIYGITLKNEEGQVINPGQLAHYIYMDNDGHLYQWTFKNHQAVENLIEYENAIVKISKQ